jgi:hypothetical protein
VKICELLRIQIEGSQFDGRYKYASDQETVSEKLEMMYRRELLSSVGAAATVLAVIEPIGAQESSVINVVINPRTVQAEVGGGFELEVVIEGATAGIAAFEFGIVFNDTAIQVREVSFAVDTLVERIERNDEGLRIEAALGSDPIDPTTSIAVATLSMERTTNEVVAVDFDSETVSDRTNTPYEVTQTTGSSIRAESVGEEDTTESESPATNDTVQSENDSEARTGNSPRQSESEDDTGPGFGLATIFGAFAAVYGLLRYRSDEKINQ